MDANLRALVAKCWKDESQDLEVGTTFVNETFVCRVSGKVVKQNDAMVAPTTSLPWTKIVALLWEKNGVCRDHSLQMLREAITEAMRNGKDTNEQIEARVMDVEAAVKAVKTSIARRLNWSDGFLDVEAMFFPVLRNGCISKRLWAILLQSQSDVPIKAQGGG